MTRGSVTIPHEYINNLRDPLLGFATVTSRALLDHLTTTYGDITPDDLEANEETLKAPWDPSTPTETLFDRAADCQAFAAQGNEPISEGQCVQMLFEVFKSLGVMDDACKDWRKKTAANRTLANMRTHFRRYNMERKRTATTTDIGYNTANAAVTTPTAPLRDTANDTSSDPPGLHYCWTHRLATPALKAIKPKPLSTT